MEFLNGIRVVDHKHTLDEIKKSQIQSLNHKSHVQIIKVDELEFILHLRVLFDFEFVKVKTKV